MRFFDVEEFLYHPSVGNSSFSEIAEIVANVYLAFIEEDYANMLIEDERLFSVAFLGSINYVKTGQLPIGRLITAVKSVDPFSGQISKEVGFPIIYRDNRLEIRRLYSLLLSIEQLVFSGITGADDETAIQRVYVNEEIIKNTFFSTFQYMTLNSPVYSHACELVQKAVSDYIFRYLIHSFSRLTLDQALIDTYEEELENLKAEL